jgi:DNA-binding NtrC family response regulator
LRERGNDILLLADFFREKYCRKYKKEIRSIATSAQRKLKEYPWPGNVRELQHAMERAVILSSGYILYADDFLLTPVTSGKWSKSLNLEELERGAIDQALKQAEGNMSRAAELLGISRFALYRKIGKQSDK